MPGTEPKKISQNPWSWVLTLYLAEGLPYALAMSVSVVLYKNLGVANRDIAFYTSWLYLPWVIKPLWSPAVDILKTRRLWIWTMQIFIGAALAAIALAIPAPHFFQITLAIFWLLAFASATHDIAADGFYMLATSEHDQAFFNGIRSTAYRIATIFAVGGLVIFAGIIQTHTSLPNAPIQIQSNQNVKFLTTLDLNEEIFSATNKNSLSVIAEPQTVQINPQLRPKSEINNLLATAKVWNVKNGFSPAEKIESKNISWWTRNISRPLGRILDNFFSPKSKTIPTTSGNIGIVRLNLSQSPNREVVVIPDLESVNGVSIVEGSRLTFNETNWNKSAILAFQLDPNFGENFSAICKLRSGNIQFSWTFSFGIAAGILLIFGIYHRFILPKPKTDQPQNIISLKIFSKNFAETFAEFFQKRKIGILLAFLLLFRLGEAQLVKMAQPFLLDTRASGGLGLATQQVGFIYGTIGVIALLCGGLLGGFMISRNGLKFWLWPMLLTIHLPDAVFIWLAFAQPQNFFVIGAGVAIEQFGYGFGFSAFMLYMIYIARGKHATAHYAICTGFMALGMMLPGMWSGWLQEHIGYRNFFVWVIFATIPSFLIAAKIPLEREFGKRAN